MGQAACRPAPERQSPKVRGPEDSGPEGSDWRGTATARRRCLGGCDREAGFWSVVANGGDGRKCRNRGRCRVSDLRKREARLADLGTKSAAFVADLVGAGTMNVAELMQHRALMGENEQQRKSQRQAASEGFHGLAKHCARQAITSHDEWNSGYPCFRAVRHSSHRAVSRTPVCLSAPARFVPAPHQPTVERRRRVPCRWRSPPH